MLARLYQRRFGIDERTLLEFPLLRRAPAEVPRLLFTHAGDAMRPPDEISVDQSAYAHAKSVLIARHPADIAISRYHHLKHRSRDKARRRLAAQPLERFIWADEGGIASIVRFLNEFAALPGITILRYEDFLAEPDESLARLAEAIGLETGPKDIADAVEFASVANLKELERQGYFSSPRLRQVRKGDQRSGKVRTGKSGGYRVQLDPDDVDRIERYVTDELDPRLGYSGSSKRRTRA